LRKGGRQSEEFPFHAEESPQRAARRFALKAERKRAAIRCNAERGPNFSDIGVSDKCNENMESYVALGFSYAHDVGLEGRPRSRSRKSRSKTKRFLIAWICERTDRN
jgi:hypothetical protein